MNPFKHLTDRLARKSQTAQPPGVDWEKFVDESLAEVAKRPASPARPKHRERSRPPVVALASGIFRQFVSAVKLLVGGVALLVLLVAAMIAFSPAGAPRAVSPTPIHHGTADRDLAAVPVARRTPARVVSEPNNRDPNNPPEPREDYYWVSESVDKNGVHRAGRWQHKPRRKPSR